MKARIVAVAVLAMAVTDASAAIKSLSRVLFILPLGLLFSAAALTQGAPDSSTRPPPPTFSRAQIQSALEAGVDLRKVNTTPGLHIVPLSETWSTAEEAEILRDQVEQQRSRGFYLVEPRKIPDIKVAMKAASNQRGFVPRHDRTFRSLVEVQHDILVRPVTLGTSDLASARLLEVRLAGSYQKDKWTGVARTFDVGDLGLVILEETDYVAGRDSVTVIKEWVNTDVNGHRGTVKTARDRAGRSLVLVGWADQSKLYSLQLHPRHPEANEANQARLMEIARKLAAG